MGDPETSHGKFATRCGETPLLVSIRQATPICAGRVGISDQISGSPIDLWVNLCPFRDQAERPTPDMVNFAQTAKSPEITKVTALKAAQKSRNLSFTRAKEKYENQHERQDQGRLPRNEGNHQGAGREGYE
jgi:hypothetical protein